MRWGSDAHSLFARPPPTGAASHFSLRPEGFGAQRLEKQGRHPESAARHETTDSGKVADDAEIHRWRGTEPLCVLDSHHTRSRLAAGTSPTATVISKGAEGQTDGQIGKPRYIQRGRDTGEGVVQSGGEGTVSSMSDAGTPGHTSLWRNTTRDPCLPPYRKPAWGGPQT